MCKFPGNPYETVVPLITHKLTVIIYEKCTHFGVFHDSNIKLQSLIPISYLSGGYHDQCADNIFYDTRYVLGTGQYFRHHEQIHKHGQVDGHTQDILNRKRY